MTADQLVDSLVRSGQPFALLYRPSSTAEMVDVLHGDLAEPSGLADLPLPPTEPPCGGIARADVLALVPYRQIAERGYACHDDGAPLLALRVSEQRQLPRQELIAQLSSAPVHCVDGGFDADDDAYSETVRQVIDKEIGYGQGANFVIMRSFVGRLAEYSPRTALAVFAQLLRAERGAYWVFLVHTKDRTLIGATPERHVSLTDGILSMNPISGTYRYPPGGHDAADLVRFLRDRKETDELSMVVDEELKMVARISQGDVRLAGPALKEMSFLAHTEYLLSARTSLDAADLIRETMFAPTVTGSPLRNACRVIERYESRGRGYYAGVAALIGRDASGARTLDAPILIRTVEIDPTGGFRLGVGATLVRHSDPVSEAAETRAKAAGLLGALGALGAAACPPDGVARLAGHEDVRRVLADRNAELSRFWLDGGAAIAPTLSGTALVVDVEDGFSAMLAHQLRAIGLRVTICEHDQVDSTDGFGVVVLGPGPGDPRSREDQRVLMLRNLVTKLLAAGQPFLSVCLSHQVLADVLGLTVLPRTRPHQGEQREIALLGYTEPVGFYNTFIVRADRDEVTTPDVGTVQLDRDSGTGEVVAMRAKRFASVQFHPESLLTRHGPEILCALLAPLLGQTAGKDPTTVAAGGLRFWA